MSDDLSDWTEPPDPVKDGFAAALSGGAGAAAVASGLASAVPVAGPLISKAIDGTLAYRHNKWLREGFDRVASRLRKLEEAGGPTIVEMLASDEFVAACAAVEQDLRRTASEEKRHRLADALLRMGPWGPDDEETRRQFFSYVERYGELHIQLLDFFENPLAWLRRGTPDYDPNRLYSGGIASVFNSYMFPGEPNWQERVSPVLADLSNDGLVESPGLNTIMTSQGVHQARITRRGTHFLAFIRSEDDDV